MTGRSCEILTFWNTPFIIQLAKMNLYTGPDPENPSEYINSMPLQPISMNVASSAPIPRGPYGRNATHTKNAEKDRSAFTMLTSWQRHNGSYRTGRASSSRSYSQEMSPPMTCGLGAQVRSTMVKHPSLSTDGSSGGMDSMLWPLEKARRRKGSVRSVKLWR